MNRALSVSRGPEVARRTMMAAAIGASMFALATALAFPLQARAQSQQPPPQIVVSATGEVVITPDRANIQLGVETEAKTAALASADNNKKQTAVLTAIKALGIPASAITTSSYNVSPIQRWDEKDRKTIIDGYRVSNLVVVNVTRIEQSGAVIDAALASGANRVAGLNFELADPSNARGEAITKAVTQARHEAEVAAMAAGGTIAELLEININSFQQPRPMPMYAMAKMASAEATPTPLSEGTLTISVNVTTRWRYGSK